MSLSLFQRQRQKTRKPNTQLISIETIAPQSGKSFLLMQGQSLKITDPEGQQVSDMFLFSYRNPNDALSSGRSIDYNEKISLTIGDQLYSNAGLAMATIIEDTCGQHDFLVTPCSLQMFQMISKTKDYHPSCLENLTKAFLVFPVNPLLITTTFNIFMNVPVDAQGRIQVLSPKSKPGDSLTIKAEMDLIVGLTACSDEATNNGSCKPIHYEIFA